MTGALVSLLAFSCSDFGLICMSEGEVGRYSGYIVGRSSGYLLVGQAVT